MTFEENQVTFDDETLSPDSEGNAQNPQSDANNAQTENPSDNTEDNVENSAEDTDSQTDQPEDAQHKRSRGRPRKDGNPSAPKKTKSKEANCEVEVTEYSNILTTEDLRLSNDSWNIMTIYTRYMGAKKTLDFEISHQRAVVWKKDKRSAYIHSILCGLHKFQPAIILNRVGKGKDVTYKVYDGKQRMLGAIIGYINGEFALCGLKGDPIIECNGKYYDVNGLKYEKLPQCLKDKITGASMNILIADNASEDIMRFIMLRINSGEQMTPFDVARIRKADMSDFNALSKHDIFKVMLTPNKYAHKKYDDLIAKTWIALYEENPKYSGSHVNDIMENLTITEEQQEEIRRLYDKLLGAYNILAEKDSPVSKEIFKVTYFTDYLRFINKFNNSERLADWFEYFFTNIPTDYSNVIKGGHSTTPGAIHDRMCIIENSINEFLGIPQ